MTNTLKDRSEADAEERAASSPGEPAIPAVDAELARTSLSNDEKILLLQIARRTLEEFLSSGEQPHFRYHSPALSQPRAVFVTLWRRDTGELRGCRGVSVARRALADEVSAMAIASAIDDPRFLPVRLEELPELRIEINALTPLRRIRAGDVEVGRHGLMVIRGQQAGLLLPEVPVRFGWNRQQFLEGTCQKASLRRDAWQDEDVAIYAFESEEWGEEA
jgi:AmmeMemoRadiSam system protein A